MMSKKLLFSTNIQRHFLTLSQRLSNVNCLLGNQVIACLVNTAKLEQASWRKVYMARLCRSKTSLIYSSVQIQGLNILFILLSLSTKSFKKSFNKQKWKLRAHNCTTIKLISRKSSPRRHWRSVNTQWVSHKRFIDGHKNNNCTLG